MSAGNRVQWIFKSQSGFGSVASGTFDELRYVDDDMKTAYDTAESDEVRSDGNVAQFDIVGMRADGQIRHKLSYGVFDKQLEYLLRADSTWGGTATLNTTISTSSVDNSFNDSGSGFTSPNFDPGKVIKAAGFSNAANNGFFLILTRTNAKITVAGAGALVTEAAAGGKTVTVGDNITNGTTQVPQTLERRYNDLASTFQRFDDCVISGFDFEFDAKSYMSGRMDFVGKQGGLQTSSASSGITSAPTNKLFKGVNNVPWFLVNSAPLTITRASMRFENTAVPTEEVNTLGPTSQGVGTFRVSGSFTAYFNATNKTVLGACEARMVIPIALALRDDNGKGYGIWLPSCVMTAGKAVGAGLDNNVVQDFTFSGYVGTSASTNLTARITRFP